MTFEPRSMLSLFAGRPNSRPVDSRKTRAKMVPGIARSSFCALAYVYCVNASYKRMSNFGISAAPRFINVSPLNLHTLSHGDSRVSYMRTAVIHRAIVACVRAREANRLTHVGAYFSRRDAVFCCCLLGIIFAETSPPGFYIRAFVALRPELSGCQTFLRNSLKRETQRFPIRGPKKFSGTS